MRRDSLPKSGTTVSPAEAQASLALSSGARGALSGIVGSIDRLHRLAVRIRAASRDDRKLEQRITQFAKQLPLDNFAEISRLILKSKFPQAEEGLIMKLKESLVFRRHRLLYQHHHQKKLSYIRRPSVTQLEEVAETSPVGTKREPPQPNTVEGLLPDNKRPESEGLEHHDGDAGAETDMVSNTNPSLVRKDRFDRQEEVDDERPEPTISVGDSFWASIAYPAPPKAEGTSTHAVCQICFRELRVVGNNGLRWWEYVATDSKLSL